MTQEVRVMLQLTLDVDATLSKERIEKKVKDAIGYGIEETDTMIDIMMVDIIEIREEAEIYGNE